MSNEKDRLVEQSANQRNPGLSVPEDFHIDGCLDGLPGGGQHGRSKHEYKALMSQVYGLTGGNPLAAQRPSVETAARKRRKTVVPEG